MTLPWPAPAARFGDPQRGNLHRLTASPHTSRSGAGEARARELDKLISGEAVCAQHVLAAPLVAAAGEKLESAATVRLGVSVATARRAVVA